jgi:hypothetical protein
MSTEPTLHLTEAQLRLVVFETSVAYAKALARRDSTQAAEHKRTRALELSLLKIAEAYGQG